MSFALRRAVRVSTAAVIAACLVSVALARPSQRVSPITDPARLPRLELDDLKYQGAFRLPADEVAGASYSFGGAPAAFNPASGTLFVGARGGQIAELWVPNLVQSNDVDKLPFATFRQRFADPSNGRIKQDIPEEGVSLSGMIVDGDRLIGSAVVYYDATNSQSVSHFSRPVALSDTGATRLVRVGQRGRVGFVAGYMAAVPPEWQSRLGAPFVTGQCCLPIISRTSWGPAAFAFDPSNIESGKDAGAQALVYYDDDHPTLGPWQGSNSIYGGTTEMGGVALISGTRTALFVGRNGTGPFCYGMGTADRSQVSTRDVGGDTRCFDPLSSDKGPHAYPYRYQAWAYDLNDLADVRAGHRAPWDVKPYAVWPLEFPITATTQRVGGIAYDVAGRRLFIAQQQADRDGYAYRAIIHVFKTP
jgi:hypothetical protein